MGKNYDVMNFISKYAYFKRAILQPCLLKTKKKLKELEIMY